jgi:hypothetical protein
MIKLISFTLKKGDSPFIHAYSIQPFFIHPWEGWLTLHSHFFNSEFLPIHPSEGLFSLLSLNTFTFFEGWIYFPKVHSPFEEGDSPFEKGDSPSKKGEWKGEYGESPFEGWMNVRVIHFSQHVFLTQVLKKLILKIPKKNLNYVGALDITFLSKIFVGWKPE